MKFCQSCDNLLYLKISDASENEKSGEAGSGEAGSSEAVSGEAGSGGADLEVVTDASADAGIVSKNNDLNQKCELKYYCRMCNETYASDESDSCVFNINFNLDNIKKNSFINDYIYDDITLPRAEGIKCPNENCPATKPEIVYIQYDKENMKFIYVCLSCHKEKIEPHIW